MIAAPTTTTAASTAPPHARRGGGELARCSVALLQRDVVTVVASEAPKSQGAVAMLRLAGEEG